jgi:hypothetical protein
VIALIWITELGLDIGIELDISASLAGLELPKIH